MDRAIAQLPGPIDLARRIESQRQRLYAVHSTCEVVRIALDSDEVNAYSMVHLRNVLGTAMRDLASAAGELDPVVMLRAEGTQS